MSITDDSVTPGELPAIEEEALWVEHLPALITGVKVQGKSDGKGASNFQARVLDARTRFLKQQFAELILNGLNVIGTLDNEAQLDDIPTEGLAKGSAYFVEATLRVWNSTEWTSSGSLLGPRGITLLGKWPDNLALPDPSSNQVGDAYIWKSDIWLLIPEPDNWVTIGLKGDNGKSAYDIAKEHGETGTEDQWLAKLVGKSAYDIWLSKGHVGTEDEFLAAMKGEDGAVGNIKLLGTLNNFAELAAIPTEGLANGSAYFVEGGISIWSVDKWVHSGSLLGPRGITLLGTWPNGLALPSPAGSSVGDAYIWRSDIWLLVPSGDGSPPPEGEDVPLPVWVSIGLEGPEGKSAYQSWLDHGHAGTEAQFLTSLIGKSNYQIWLGQGNTGTEQDFLDTLKSTEPGPPGKEGPAKAPFVVKGSKPSEADLPTPGNETEAWYVGSHMYVWVTSEAQYVDLGSVGGMSAYELAVSDGFPGTLQQWLASLKSTEPGPKGERGQNLTVKGTVANAGQLGNIHDPQEQDGYVTDDDGHLYILTSSIWKDVGPFRGQSTYQLWLDQGHSGSSAEFLASLKGKDGKDGVNVKIKGSVATFVALPATPEEQDVYSVRDTNTLYAFIGGNWASLGTFKGADGLPGNDGANGSSITIIKILTPQDPVVPDAAANPGKAYVDLDKHIQLSLGGVWIDGGPVGAPGDRGAQGTGIKLKGTVAGPTYLPLPKDSEDGDGWFTLNDKMLYVLTDGEWAGPFDITGLPGPQGNDGEKGDAGTSINILGAYNTLADLAAAVPTGKLGDGYLVGNNLAIWTTADGGKWIDIGLVRGPQGIQGVPGPIGIGKKGDKGEKGSSWITLPAGVDEPGAGFTGNVGDWAVSDTFKVYYKSAIAGWQYWGRLVAGDVNSPLLSFGKAVRLGNEWIMLPVDEAPNMIDGELYVRALISGSTSNEGEWVKLVFPKGIEEPPADGKPYFRMCANGQPVGSWGLFTMPTLASLGGVPTSALGFTVATLVDGFVPSSQLPSYVDDVLEFDNRAAFPNPGEKGKIYIADDTNVQYRWTGTTYIGLVASPGTTDAVTEGATNLYFTQARVRTVPLTGLSLLTNSAIVAADTVITAFGKLQAQINAFTPGFADVPTDTNLYLRKGDHTWSLYTAPTPGVAAPANDGKTYVYKGTGWISFDRYDLAIQNLSATGTVDPLVTGVLLINNSSSTAKTITIGDGPKAPARGQTLVVKVTGATGAITFSPTGATVLVWSGGAPPSLTGSRTTITFLWDGVEWNGSAGGVVP